MKEKIFFIYDRQAYFTVCMNETYVDRSARPYFI